MSVIAWSVRMCLYQFINRDKTTYQGQLDEQGIFYLWRKLQTRVTYKAGFSPIFCQNFYRSKYALAFLLNKERKDYLNKISCLKSLG